MRRTTVLGYIVGNGVKTPEPDKTEAIAKFSQPCTKSDVRSFLTVTGYYQSFVPDYMTISGPLSDATKKSMPTTVNWSSECDRAFIRWKELLCSDPLLQAPNFDDVFIVQTDAFEDGLGAVLGQANHKDQESPAVYISHKLLQREQMYSTIEKEALAINWAIKKLKVYILGREFVGQTDHAPLQFMEHHANNARIARWGLALQPFWFSVRHRPRHCNRNADSLSCLWTWTFFFSFLTRWHKTFLSSVSSFTSTLLSCSLLNYPWSCRCTARGQGKNGGVWRSSPGSRPGLTNAQPARSFSWAFACCFFACEFWGVTWCYIDGEKTGRISRR